MPRSTHYSPIYRKISNVRARLVDENTKLRDAVQRLKANVPQAEERLARMESQLEAEVEAKAEETRKRHEAESSRAAAEDAATKTKRAGSTQAEADETAKQRIHHLQLALRIRKGEEVQPVETRRQGGDGDGGYCEYLVAPAEGGAPTWCRLSSNDRRALGIKGNGSVLSEKALRARQGQPSVGRRAKHGSGARRFTALRGRFLNGVGSGSAERRRPD